MKNRELYVKDPGAMRLLNNGVAEVAEVDTEALRQTLRFELETFVCKGEYHRGLVRIMESFLGSLGQPEQPPVWVRGGRLITSRFHPPLQAYWNGGMME